MKNKESNESNNTLKEEINKLNNLIKREAVIIGTIFIGILILCSFVVFCLPPLINKASDSDKKPRQITLYSQSGEILKVYKTNNYVGVGSYGVYFYDDNSKKIELNGTYTIE